MVLVELGEDRRHLALAEGVVERVIDRLRRDAEAAEHVAIDLQIHTRRGSLQIAGHVLEFGQRGEPGQHDWRPLKSSATSGSCRVY